MRLIDRLIAKARVIKLVCSDNVFIISNETGKWMADSQDFPSLETAQEYVEGLVRDADSDITVIINDIGPRDQDALNSLAVPVDWLERIRKENAEIRRRELEEERRNRPPEKDRRLI